MRQSRWHPLTEVEQRLARGLRHFLPGEPPVGERPGALWLSRERDLSGRRRGEDSQALLHYRPPGVMSPELELRPSTSGLP